jgi:hypothetical protein
MQKRNKIMQDKRRDRIPKNTKTLTTIDNLLTINDVEDVITELIKDRSEITDLVVIYRTRNGKPSCITTASEFERLIALVDHIKFKMHEAQSAMDDFEETTNES